MNPNQSKVFCHVDDVVKSSFRILSKNLKNKDIEIITDFKNSSEVNINKSELMQAIINILNNSKDAFEIKSIKDRKIYINTYDYEERVILDIEDNAGGIEEDKIDKIFDAYFTTKKDYNGTGLGLHIVKIVIEEHLKGSIKASNRNSGLNIKISLPINI